MALYSLFFQKIISAKIYYKTHNQKLLTIVEAFKTWYHYLEDCKYEIFVFTNHNNLCQFMNTKKLGTHQVQ